MAQRPIDSSNALDIEACITGKIFRLWLCDHDAWSAQTVSITEREHRRFAGCVERIIVGHVRCAPARRMPIDNSSTGVAIVYCNVSVRRRHLGESADLDIVDARTGRRTRI